MRVGKQSRCAAHALLAAMLSTLIWSLERATAQTVVDPDAALREFVERHRCPILTRLDLIRSHRQPSHRYIVLWPSGDEARFVQCIFMDDAGQRVDDRLYCEAASGHFTKPDKSVKPADIGLTSREVAAVAELGFELDFRKGNFSRTMDVAEPTGLVPAAEMMAKTLFLVYGARVGTRILHKAPLVRDEAAVRLRCAPTS